MGVLQADLHVSSRPAINLPPREGREWLWSGLANTLIHDKDFALLVDTSITIKQNEDLIAWIKQTLGDRPLTHFFLTHGHNDHYLGLPALLDAFPGLKILATQDVLDQKIAHDTGAVELWSSLFPDQLDLRDNWTAKVIATEGDFSINGHAFRVISVGHGDCPHSSVLYVPELELVCAGDVVIATHLYFAEANTTEKRKEWLAALDMIESLKPQIVVPGHMRAGQVPGAKFMIDDTRRYILAWEEEVDRSRDSDQLFEAMRKRYPGRFGDFVLQFGADTAFQNKEA